MPFITLSKTDANPALTLHYEIWGDRFGMPNVVLIHELGGTLASFREFGKLLTTNFRLIVFDQRGAGMSEKPKTPFSLSDLADDILRLTEALHVPRPFHMLGLAMGAIVALHFAVRHPGRLDSLVLCDGAHEIDENVRRYLLDRAAAVRNEGMSSVAASTLKKAFYGLPDSEDGPAWEEYRQRFLGNSPESYALHSEALAGMNLGAEELTRICCRTLVLTGRHDVIWGPDVGQALSSKLHHGRFEVVESAAHFPPIQNPTVVAARVTTFLSYRDE